MHPPKPQSKFLLIYISACLLLLFYAWYHYPYVADDSFISFRYSQRLLEGKGLTWTDGKPVEGYSNLLWVLLMALLESITHAEFWIIAWVTGFVCSIITLWLLMRIVGQATNNSIPALVVSAGIFAASASVAVWINGGLESPLSMVLLVAAIYFLMRGDLLKNIGLPGIILGLLALTRPDGILFTWCISLGLILFLLLSSSDPFTFKKIPHIVRTHFRPLLLLNLIVLLFYGGQLLFRLSYYGEWVPNTARVKISFTWSRINGGLIYINKLMIIYAPFLAGAFWFVRKSEPGYKAWLAFLTTTILIYSLYLVVIGGDFFPGLRLGVPLVPLLAILGGIVFILSVGRFWVNVLGYPVAAIIVLLYVSGLQLMSYTYHKAILDDRWEWEARGIGETLKEGYSDQQPSIALAAAGMVPYITNFPALDLLGLNDYYLPRHLPEDFGKGRIGHELGNADYYMQQSPDIFLWGACGDSLPDVYKEEARLYNMEKFKTQYVGVKLLCHFDYTIAIPRWEHGWKFNIRSDKPCYPFIRKYSPRIGIRPAGSGTILIPSCFFLSRRSPDQRSVIQLNDQKQLVLAIPPGEAYFLPQKDLSPFLNMDQLGACRFIPVVPSGQSLSVSLSQGGLEISNSGLTRVELKEILIIQPTSRLITAVKDSYHPTPRSVAH